MRRMKRFFGVLLACIFLLVGCQKGDATQIPSLFEDGDLPVYVTQTLTPTATNTPPGEATATEPPLPTSTPMTYTVKAGETLFSIAANNGITTDAIRAANPSVNPYLVGPGLVLIIPPAEGEPVQSSVQIDPAVTPYPLTTGEVNCTPSLSGGLYCFAELVNSQEMMADNLAAIIQLRSGESRETLEQTALIPLTRLRSGGSLPVFAYFPPPVFGNPEGFLKLVSATTVNQNGTPTAAQDAVILIDDPDVVISANSLSVTVTGGARFEASEGTSGRLWIAAVALDVEGKVVGIRRFSTRDAYSAGETIPFNLNIYSIGEKIDRVELYGELNP